MEKIKTTGAVSTKKGIAGIILLFIILFILLGGLFAFDYGYIAYTKQTHIYPTATPPPGVTYTPITARGSFSKDAYSVNITLYFVSEGGSVSGDFSGDCSGVITGYYDGKDGGVISGNAYGSCDPLFVPIPASAEFSGVVQKSQKAIPVTGKGSAMGVSGEGSLTFTF